MWQAHASEGLGVELRLCSTYVACRHTESHSYQKCPHKHSEQGGVRATHRWCHHCSAAAATDHIILFLPGLLEKKSLQQETVMINKGGREALKDTSTKGNKFQETLSYLLMLYPDWGLCGSGPQGHISWFMVESALVAQCRQSLNTNMLLLRDRSYSEAS